MDVAKRLIDLGYHPSTVYFPLVVDEAMMVEPTETETKETLEAFAAAMRQAAAEARTDPDLLHEAPVTTPVRRLDEARAARHLKLRWGSPDRPSDAEPIDGPARGRPVRLPGHQGRTRPHRSRRPHGDRGRREGRAALASKLAARRRPTASSSSSLEPPGTTGAATNVLRGRDSGRSVSFTTLHNVRYGRYADASGPRRREPRLHTPHRDQPERLDHDRRGRSSSVRVRVRGT